MQAPVVNTGTDLQEPVDAKLPYTCPSVVALDLISTEGAADTQADGVNGSAVSFGV